MLHATPLTQAGYVGEDVKVVIQRLLQVRTGQWSIWVFGRLALLLSAIMM